VRAANQSGGKDNITVILFRLGEGEPAAAPATIAPAPADEDTIVGLKAEDLQAAASAPPDAGAPDATMIHRRSEPIAPPTRAERPRRRRGRGVLRAVAALLIVAAVAGGLYALSRQVYFVGTNDAGLVTVYQGIPYELPFGVDLYTEDYASGMPARAIPSARRARVLDHEWRSREDAEDLVRTLERGQLDAGASD
jgi:PPM family protein phosphatase